MKRISLLAFYLSILCVLNTSAQDIPEFKKQHFVDSISGKIFWNKNIPFGIKVFSTNSTDEVDLYSDQANLIYFDTEGLNTIKSPWLIDPVTKNYATPKVDVKFRIYADGLAPITKLTYMDAPKYTKAGNIYIGKNLRINLVASDALSGVNKLLLSINNKDFLEFIDTLSINQEGKYSIQYLSADHVGNVEDVNSSEFIVDTTAPKTYHSITGIDLKNNIISSTTKITLKAEDESVGIKTTYYAIDGGTFKTYNGGIIPVKELSNGNHSISYYSIDNVKNKEQKNTLKFYLDKQAPILSSDILGDRYVVNDQVYFSGRTKLKLTAFDNKSGVKHIMYSINKEDFKVYSEPFYLPSREGLHSVEYYSVDKTENHTGGDESNQNKAEEFKHKVVKKIFTDLVGPSLNHKFTGNFFPTRDTVFISPQTTINLSAIDGESGLQYISYSIDQDKEEIKYDKPFSISKKGLHEIEFFAYDNVNNRNKSSFLCFVDNEPPVAYVTFSIPAISTGTTTTEDSTSISSKIDTYPYYASIYLAAKDIIVGTDRISYSLNDAPLQPYLKPIEGFIKNQLNTLKIVSYDKLENKGIKEIEFFITE